MLNVYIWIEESTKSTVFSRGVTLLVRTECMKFVKQVSKRAKNKLHTYYNSLKG